MENLKTRFKGYEIEIDKRQGGFGFTATDPNGTILDSEEAVCSEDNGLWMTEAQAYKWACFTINSDIQYEETKWMVDEHRRVC